MVSFIFVEMFVSIKVLILILIVQFITGEEIADRVVGNSRTVIEFYMNPTYAIHPKGATRVYEKLINQFDHIESKLGRWLHRNTLVHDYRRYQNSFVTKNRQNY